MPAINAKVCQASNCRNIIWLNWRLKGKNGYRFTLKNCCSQVCTNKAYYERTRPSMTIEEHSKLLKEIGKHWDDSPAYQKMKHYLDSMKND